MSKAQLTTNVYELQDALARAYKSPTEPERDKERLADVWIVEGTLRSNQSGKPPNQNMIRVRPKTKKYTKLFELKEKRNGNR